MKKVLLLFMLAPVFLFGQTTTVNVLTYNILNYPNANNSGLDGNAIRAVYFRQVVEDAGADIIILQELRSTDGMSATGTANADLLVDELNNNGTLGKTYARATTYSGYGGWGNFLGNMLIYNANMFNLVSEMEVPRINMATAPNGNMIIAPRSASHYVLSHPVNPTCPEQEVELNVFSTHLKAGTSTGSSTTVSDEIRRNLGALDIVDYVAANLTTSDNILVGGDLNLQGDFELAYNTLITNTTDPLVDPVGPWTRNIAGDVDKYTQSTRKGITTYGNGGAAGGLDDRFDMWLFNNNVSSGIEQSTYVANSNETWGAVNVGWNQGATDGTYAFKTEVELMSDHYPVFLQLELEASSSLCSNCEVVINDTGTISSGVYSASNYIDSDGTINAPENVTYFGGNYVELKPGFEVHLGAQFLGDIQTCTPFDGEDLDNK